MKNNLYANLLKIEKIIEEDLGFAKVRGEVLRAIKSMPKSITLQDVQGQMNLFRNKNEK